MALQATAQQPDTSIQRHAQQHSSQSHATCNHATSTRPAAAPHPPVPLQLAAVHVPARQELRQQLLVRSQLREAAHHGVAKCLQRGLARGQVLRSQQAVGAQRVRHLQPWVACKAVGVWLGQVLVMAGLWQLVWPWCYAAGALQLVL